MKGPQPPQVEIERRQLMRHNRKLYDYIEAHVAQRELERAGGDASGATDNYGAANRVWNLAGRWRQRKEQLAAAPRTTGGAVQEPTTLSSCVPGCDWLTTREHLPGCQT